MVRSNLVSISVGYPMPLQIILKNSQNVASPSPFQQMLQLEASEINSVLPSSTPQVASDFHNIRFKYNNSYIPAWLESINNGVATIWVKLPVSIPANSSITIDMEVDPYLNFDGVYWGENPLLSSTYAQYDNGANVFPYYQRWGSLNALPTGWSSISGTGLNFAPTYTEISAGPNNQWYGIYLNPLPQSFLAPTVWSLYGNLYSVKYAPGLEVGTSIGNNNNPGYLIDDVNSSGLPPPDIYFDNIPNYISTGYTDTNNNKLYSMQLNSPTSVQIYINYSQIYSTSSAASQDVSYFVITPVNNPSYGPAGPAYIYWLRTTANPPNGVMPSVEVIA